MAFVRKRGNSYQLIETYRVGSQVKQRIIVNLGRYRSLEEAMMAEPDRFAHVLDPYDERPTRNGGEMMRDRDNIIDELENKLAAAEARERVLRYALALAVDYDNLLLRFKGPAVLYDGDNKAIDAAYDKWVAAARAALSAHKDVEE